MEKKFIERYFFFGLLLATLIFTFIIFRPFLTVLILGASLATVLYPLYDWFNKKRLPRWLSALITVVLFVVVLLGPFLSIGTIVFNQAQGLYRDIVLNGNAGAFVDKVDASINKILPSGIDFDIQDKVSGIAYYVSNNIARIFSTTFSAFFSFILMLLAIFYFLKDGAHFKRVIVVLSPLEDHDDEKIITRLSRAVNGVIKGYLLIALAQGILMWLGLWIFGVPNPALWGVVAAITSLVPTVGTALVAVPAIIFLFATGSTGPGIGLLVWSVAIVGTIDNFLSPYVISGKTNVPPFLILFSVLGGIALMGPMGILIGPLAISLLYTLVSIYRHEYKETSILK
ncbi:MAG: AI-2E family transporter [bacterium]